MILSPVFPFEDVAYGTFNTSVHTAIASEYGCGLYAKSLENYHKKLHRAKIRYFICGVHKQDTLFDAVSFRQIYHENPFCAW